MLSLPLGALFAEQGNMYLVTRPNRIRIIDIHTNIPASTELETDGQSDVRIIGAAYIFVPLSMQIPYHIAKGNFVINKLDNAKKKNEMMLNDIIKCIKQELFKIMVLNNVGFKKNLYICSIGNITFGSIGKELSTYVEAWNTFKVSTYSNYLNVPSIQLLMGKRYPKKIGQEVLTVEGLRFSYTSKRKHFRDRHFRMECHIVSRNSVSGRTLGTLNEKKLKAKAIVLRKKLDQVKQKIILLHQKFGKPGQICEQPATTSGAYIFYRSLFEEDSNDMMSISWLLYYGCFELELAEQLYSKYKNILFPHETFDISI